MNNMTLRESYSYRTDPAVPPFADDRPLLVFDGHCVLCSGGAQFVLRFDRRKIHRLAAAQSALGRALYAHYGLTCDDSFILLAEGRAWFKSEASIRVGELLGWPWSLARVLRLLPLRLRDVLYDFLARNRLWLGRRELCFTPGANDRDRFLE
jgi:predicted DCC family thiol-disulfide oxidoreductase YuxK